MSAQPPSSPEEPTAQFDRHNAPTEAIASDSNANGLQLTPGQILGGRYRVVSLIGRGGMGEVYRADDLKIGHAVALKFLSDRARGTRIFDEVRVGREIAHPNVCRVYDFAEADGRLFITMELIDGEDLASLLRRVGRLPPEKALAVARDICAGVAAAHEKGVIHRDLKPANVMIDGRGRARVMDFGLAVAGGEATDTSGTPAYMAPEQLSGGAASFASDVYALGLVLYEIFTGRRPFEASSIPALLRRQQDVDYARPGSITSDVPAAVERLIARCLDPDPKQRPASVHEMMRELPGGDPLAAAIAAGETPTPGMVAAAARSGELRPLTAWALLLVALAGIVIAAVVSERTILRRASAIKPPDVLRERAREILALAGMTERPADSDLFVHLESYTGALAAVYRQSPRPMRPQNPDFRLLPFDPSLDRGMANVHLDSLGLLCHLIIAPPIVESSPPRGVPSWEPFITAAGHDPRLLRAVAPQWPAAIVFSGRSASAYVDSDNKAAWVTKDGNRIEAASFRGRPVFFSVITPATMRVVREKPGLPASFPERLAYVMFIIFMIGIPMAGTVLARANLRGGRGDRVGAFRMATFFLAAFLIGLIFRAHHPLNFVDEWIMVSWHIAQATFWALMTAFMYIALEPFVRSRWPQMLISWVRLLSGRFTDPMVGRDVLLGAAGAAAASVIWQATHVVTGQTAFFTRPSTLGPARFVVSVLASTLAESMLRAIGLVVLLVLVRSVVRHDAATSIIATLLVAAMNLDDTYGPLWLRAGYAVTVSLLAVLLARHFGVLAVMSYAYFVLIQQRIPLTLDTSVWFFSRSAIVMLFLFAWIAFAFRISVGSKQWLPRVALE